MPARQGFTAFIANNIIPKYGEKIKSLSQQIFLNGFMNNDQDIQNITNNTAVLLVVLHKKTLFSRRSKRRPCIFLDIITKQLRLICAFKHKIYEII